MSSNQAGYVRWPTVHGERVVFVSEDDLWEVALQGGAARRLTSGLGEARYPAFSPDGSKIAYVSTEEGATEVYVMDADGGPGRQLTFLGTAAAVVGWSPDGKAIRFRSSYAQQSPRKQTVFEVDSEGGPAQPMKLGVSHWLWNEPGGTGRVLGRHADDLARWKRYRGGTAGALWIEAGDGWRRLLPELESGLVRPIWIDGRIWFLCDEHGYGNLYSCTPGGEDLRQHTQHHGFYARGLHSDGETFVYTVGGEVYRLGVGAAVQGASPERIPVDYASPRTQMNRKFVSGDDWVEDYSLHPRGHSLVVAARGKAFNFGNWEGAVRQSGEPQGVRYRMPQYAKDGDTIVVISDAGGEERVEIHTVDGSADPRAVEHGDIGRAVDVALSPDGTRLAMSNHRHELLVVHLESGDVEVVDRGLGLGISGFDWSADSRWLAYGISDTWKTSFLRIVDTTDWTRHDVTEPGFRDSNPCFDPKGRYLYFVSQRWFEPVPDSLFFEVSFPKSAKPCVITLRDELESLFFEKPRPLEGDDEEDGDDKDEKEGDGDSAAGKESVKKESDDGDDAKEKGDAKDGGDDDDASEEDEVEPVVIEFENIGSRIEAFPVGVGHYFALQATDERLFWLAFPEGDDDDDDQPGGGILQTFDLQKRRMRGFARGVHGYTMSADRKSLVYEGSEGLRVVSAGSDGGDEDDTRPSRRSGWVDLGRIAIAIDPRDEWRQMLREAWRLMRDQYWHEDLVGIDWDEVWERYSGQLPRVASRSEFSDLVWTMQGELGTSHAYEYGGDYRLPPQYPPGHLGADVTWDADDDAYRIDRIYRGSSWDVSERSPLTAPGLNVREGDHIVAVNGRRVCLAHTLQEALVHTAGQEVELLVRGSDGESKPRTVRTMRSEYPVRYRQWVNDNRRRVHEASGGKLGYIHIPDMSPHGYAEFHRGFLAELRRDGLVVDVRNNGGGNVSQLILEKLARTRIGYDVGRWSAPLPYPEESIAGPIVAITDENAGSDGDIFSHCFKLMGIGTLVGKRTWGGVVGIWPRHRLADGSVVTQPEFAFWFEDVGFGVENWGTMPDVDVELAPQTESAGEDAQLDTAIRIALEQFAAKPSALPAFGDSTTIIKPPPRSVP